MSPVSHWPQHFDLAQHRRPPIRRQTLRTFRAPTAMAKRMQCNAMKESIIWLYTYGWNALKQYTHLTFFSIHRWK